MMTCYRLGGWMTELDGALKDSLSDYASTQSIGNFWNIELIAEWSCSFMQSLLWTKIDWTDFVKLYIFIYYPANFGQDVAVYHRLR